MEEYLSFDLENSEFDDSLYLVMTNKPIDHIEEYLNTIDTFNKLGYRHH